MKTNIDIVNTTFRLIIIALGTIVGSLLLAACSSAPDEPADYTQEFVQQAIDRYNRDGRADTIAYYNTAASVDGEWYVFIADEMGRIIAHPTIPTNVGRNLNNFDPDLNGYDFGPDLVSAPDTGRWVSYVYLNPQISQEELKHAWAVSHDGLTFISGWYEK